MPERRTKPLQPDAVAKMRADVWAGLNRPQKELSPKYFYDDPGSELFDRITQLPEYYLTRTESALLERFVPDWLHTFAPHTLVELGPGSATKTRILLRPMDVAGAVYVPVDISAAYLASIVADAGATFDNVRILPSQSDITHPLELRPDLPRPVLFAFLGSTIGNFKEDAAVRLLGNVRNRMAMTDRFLMGVDLVKDVHVLEAAYNDAEGVTAAFNRNVLSVLNRELGTDFDPDRFAHRAFFETSMRRIEMHLVSRQAQVVRVPRRGTVHFRRGESIRTEISCKYDRATIASLFGRADLDIEHWVTDPQDWYTLVVGRPC